LQLTGEEQQQQPKELFFKKNEQIGQDET